MPLYEYHCSTCESTVEVLQRRPEEKPECPACHSHEMEKLLSVTAAPSVKGAVRGGGATLPMASGESCGAPRCCGGGCNF